MAVTLDPGGGALEGELITAEEAAAAEEAGASKSELLQIFNLKEQAQNFATAFRDLMAMQDAVEGTELEAEYHDLVDRGLNLRDRIESVMSSVDSAMSWVRDKLSWLPGLGTVGSRSLGVVWFIPVAAIAAVIGAVTLWLSDYSKFARRFSEQQRIADQLMQQGVAPVEAQRQAAAAVADAAGGFLKPLGDALPWIALGAGGFFLWRYLRR